MDNRASLLAQWLQKLAEFYDIRIMSAFGSRAGEIQEVLNQGRTALSPGLSDLDIGVKTSKKLSINEKVDLAKSIEDLFDVKRVDLVILDEVPTSIAYQAVTGTLLYATDPVEESEYQLYVMRRFAELLPYYRKAEGMLLGANP